MKYYLFVHFLGAKRVLSTEEMAEFYRTFLADNHTILRAYNRQWYRRNFGLLWPAFRVTFNRFARRFIRWCRVLNGFRTLIIRVWLGIESVWIIIPSMVLIWWVTLQCTLPMCETVGCWLGHTAWMGPVAHPESMKTWCATSCTSGGHSNGQVFLGAHWKTRTAVYHQKLSWMVVPVHIKWC